MRIKKAAVALLTTMAWLFTAGEAGQTSTVKVCGRRLSDIMSRVCQEYNSPTWVNEAGEALMLRRRRREVGLADLCCKAGCTWEQLSDFCSGSNPEPIMPRSSVHTIADRSAENGAAESLIPPEAYKVRGARRRAVSEDRVEVASRAAPIVGTVSPLLRWGRTLNTDLPQTEPSRFAYLAYYAEPYTPSYKL